VSIWGWCDHDIIEGKFDDFKNFNEYANSKETFSPQLCELPSIQYGPSGDGEEGQGGDIQDT
jgi:hypothetical protein